MFRRRDDIESNDEQDSQSFHGFDERDVRRAFICKVYMLVTAQLLFTVGSLLFFMYNRSAFYFVEDNIYLIYISMGVTLAVMLLIGCVKSLRRQTPINYICLCIFTFGEAFMVGFIGARYSPSEVLLALGITVALVVGLTIFAIQTRIDFTLCSSFIFVAVLLLFIFGIVLIFVRMPILHLVFSFLAVLVFSLVLIIDTQMMLGGNHAFSIDAEDYIFAAMSIYVDIIIIFLQLLNIINTLN